MHYENGAWVDVTTSLDTDANRICGNVASLSPFAVFQAEIKPFVFLASKDVEIDRNGASEGNIHANVDITFKKGKPSTHKGDLTAVDDVTINSNNTIVGNVTAGDRVQRSSGVKVTGVVNEDPGTPVIPLPAPSFTAGGNDVTVSSSGTLTLAPGTYDEVTVNKNATLQLSSGNYKERCFCRMPLRPACRKRRKSRRPKTVSSCQ